MNKTASKLDKKRTNNPKKLKEGRKIRQKVKQTLHFLTEKESSKEDCNNDLPRKPSEESVIFVGTDLHSNVIDLTEESCDNSSRIAKKLQLNLETLREDSNSVEFMMTPNSQMSLKNKCSKTEVPSNKRKSANIVEPMNIVSDMNLNDMKAVKNSQMEPFQIHSLDDDVKV